jgi:hypothetical protein
VRVLEVSQVVLLVLTESRNDLRGGDELHDLLCLLLDLVELLDNLLLALAEVCTRGIG